MTHTPATPPATNAYPARTIKTRRIAFDYPDAARTAGTPRGRQHYVGGDLIMSHVVSVLSGLFPEGEDFFVRSVRHHAERVTDPELRKQVAGFVGQEVTHGREHRELNDRLHRMGYPTHWVDRSTRAGLRRNERFLGPTFCLAITAALEHYTATLAQVLLDDPRARELLGTSEVREMLLWHALEESEHKSVAFDVFAEACGVEKVRVRAMRMVNVSFLGATLIHTLISLAGDRRTYNPIRLARSAAALRHSPFLSRQVITRLRAYNRPGFHPDDLGGAEQVEAWRAELFGPDGRLTPHLV